MTFAEIDSQNEERRRLRDQMLREPDDKPLTPFDQSDEAELGVRGIGGAEAEELQSRRVSIDAPELALPQPDIEVSFGAFGDLRTVALLGALAEAQGTFGPVVKNRSVTIRQRAGGSYTFEYADLAAIRDATQGALCSNGLAILSFPVKRSGDRYLRTLLTHREGGFIWAELPIPSSADGETSEAIKAFGGYMTYLRRYLIIGMLNLSADPDLDEDGSDGRHKVSDPAGGSAEAMKEAKTIQELAGIMSRIPEKEKTNYLDLFNRRSSELRSKP